MTDGFYIAPSDEPIYREVIRERRELRQRDVSDELPPSGIRACLVVTPPSGFEPGECLMAFRDVAYPYCYELSVNGYPGFGVLDNFRAKIKTDRVVEFSFPRDATAAQVEAAFPSEWLSKIRATGGFVETSDGKSVNVGRYIIGFSEPPEEFGIAETDEPPEGYYGYDDNGFPLPAPRDEHGFTTIDDSRVTARLREVPHLLSTLTKPFWTMVDTSQPSPIAAGAMFYGAQIPGIGLSLISCEPRVYQELSPVFATVPDDAAFDDPAVEESEEEP